MHNWWACWLNLVLTCQNFILKVHWDFHLHCSQVCSINVACIGMSNVPDHWCGTACHTCGHTSVHNDMEACILHQGSVRSLLHLILQSAHLGVSGMNIKHLKPVYHDVDIGHNILLILNLTMWRVKYSVSHEDSIWHNMPVTVLRGSGLRNFKFLGWGETQSFGSAATTLPAPDDGWMNMELWWNDNDRGKLKYLETNLFQCHFVHYKFNTGWSSVRSQQLTTSAVAWNSAHRNSICEIWDSHSSEYGIVRYDTV